MQEKRSDIITTSIMVTAPNNLRGQEYIEGLCVALNEKGTPYIRKESTVGITVKWGGIWEI